MNITLLLKRLAPILVGMAIYALPHPADISYTSWNLLAIFAATITAMISQPLPIGASILISLVLLIVSKTLSPEQALKGFSNPTVWLVVAACLMARSMKTSGLGRRIALFLITKMGKRSLGLSYALNISDFLMASVIPSNGARMGSIIYPVLTDLSYSYDSYPGSTAKKLGAFLTVASYQAGVISCAIFLTGQAANPIIAKLAGDNLHFHLDYNTWLYYSIVPGLIALAIVPWFIYKIYPPELTYTPEAPARAQDELNLMGPMTWKEIILAVNFLMMASLWTIGAHFIDYNIVSLLGISILLISGVLTWDDALSEKTAWDVFIWYGGLITIATALNEAGLTKAFASYAVSWTFGMTWPIALVILILIYFYSHYGFASITAHAMAMFTPFALVVASTGAPSGLVVLLLAYASNLNAGLTHYGTTPAPIYFAGGFVNQKDWWRIGFYTSLINLVIWGTVGIIWWKLCGVF